MDFGGVEKLLIFLLLLEQNEMIFDCNYSESHVT